MQMILNSKYWDKPEELEIATSTNIKQVIVFKSTIYRLTEIKSFPVPVPSRCNTT
jgi:hypothetical protein